jgi:hypothetical protein
VFCDGPPVASSAACCMIRSRAQACIFSSASVFNLCRCHTYTPMRPPALTAAQSLPPPCRSAGPGTSAARSASLRPRPRPNQPRSGPGAGSAGARQPHRHALPAAQEHV